MAKIPVLIAGGGPVGLALAVELGRSGVACTLVERRDGSLSVPKMSGLSVRSMELNRRWGIAEKVKRNGWPQTRPNDFEYCTSMIGPSLTRVRIPPYVDKHPPHTPEPDCGCAQIFYDPILTFAGWRQIDSFNQGETTVWTTIGIPKATTIPSPLRPPRWQGIMWGTVPFGTSLVTIALAFFFSKKKDASEGDETFEEKDDRESVGRFTLLTIPNERTEVTNRQTGEVEAPRETSPAPQIGEESSLQSQREMEYPKLP